MPRSSPQAERMSRRPGNGPEGELHDWATSRGLFITKRGWPDFFIIREDETPMLVEVKPRRSSRLKFAQLLVLRTLAEHGVPCYRWSPEGGFEQILGDNP